jgi:ribosomal protein S18 acetylase RimI-like enzyme
MIVRWMTASDATLVDAASHLFDDPASLEYIAAFFAHRNHHLAIAYVDDQPAGFVSGVEIAHPDKRTEMFLYELGVDEAFRGRGVGKTLVVALRDLAIERGCRGMWVLTDNDNDAALATYRSAGAGEPEPQVLLEWTLP